LMEPTAPGSHLMISPYASDLDGGAMATAASKQEGLAKAMRWPFVPRDREEVSRFFDGLELVDPGVVAVELWRPPSAEPPAPSPPPDSLLPGYAAIGRKPAGGEVAPSTSI
jgi:hypothetical protein